MRAHFAYDRRLIEAALLVAAIPGENMKLIRAALLVALCAAACAAGAAEYPARPADGQAGTWIVTAPATHLGIQAIASDVQYRRSAAGTLLALARIDADAVDVIARHVHENERRCGGFFAFSSLQEAEAFLAEDRSALAQAMPLGGIYTIDNHATVDPWLDQASEPNIRGTIASLSAFRNRYYTSSYGHAAAQWIAD